MRRLQGDIWQSRLHLVHIRIDGFGRFRFAIISDRLWAYFWHGVIGQIISSVFSIWYMTNQFCSALVCYLSRLACHWPWRSTHRTLWVCYAAGCGGRREPAMTGSQHYLTDQLWRKTNREGKNGNENRCSFSSTVVFKVSVSWSIVLDVWE